MVTLTLAFEGVGLTHKTKYFPRAQAVASSSLNVQPTPPALEHRGAKKWMQEPRRAELGLGSRPLYSKCQAYPAVPALLLELSKHKETIQGNQGPGAASIVWTENATGIQRGELKVAAKNRQQFPSFSLQNPQGRGWGGLGAALQSPPSWPCSSSFLPHLPKAGNWWWGPNSEQEYAREVWIRTLQRGKFSSYFHFLKCAFVFHCK